MGSDDGRFDGVEDDIEALEVKQILTGQLAANMRVDSIFIAILVSTVPSLDPDSIDFIQIIE